MADLKKVNKKPFGQIVPVQLVFRPFGFSGNIGPIVFDALISERHELNSDVTEHAVEKGAAISDHVRPTPIMVTLEGIISNTPIGEAQTIRAQNSTGLEDGRAIEHSEDAFRRLEDVRNNARLVTIITPLKTYDNMAMQSLSIPRDRTTGDALRFSATFKQVRVVTNKDIVVQVPRAKKRSNLGTKSTTATSTATKDKSVNQTSSLRLATDALGLTN